MRSLLLASLLLTACTLDHTPPGTTPAAPDAWTAPLPEGTSLPGLWWQAYSDETLGNLVTTALENSPRLGEAKARVAEARGQRRTAEGALFPQVDVAGTSSRGNQGIRTFGNPNTLYEASFDASYEIDLFGGNAARVDAAEADIRAREASYEDARLTLAAEVVREYSDYRRLQRQAALTGDTVTSQREGLRLTRTRFAAGIATDLEVAQAESLALATEAQLPPIEQGAKAALLRLSVLTALPPAEVQARLQEARPVPVPDVTPLLEQPAVVLARRPDLAAAAASLQNASALSVAETTELYPSITLSALFGVQDTSAFGGFNIWSLGAGLAAPLLNFGRIEGRIDAAEAREEAAYQAYRQSTLEALADVETALSDLVQQRNRRLVLAKSVEADARALMLARTRYTDGIVPFLDVLTAEQQALKSQLALADAEGAEATAFASLSKALALPVAAP
jgi:NodT family efflux transporter outer membrane factor (OMF) lipoprotein